MNMTFTQSKQWCQDRCRPKEIRRHLGDDQVTVAPDFTHLGLHWSEGNLTPNIEVRIQLARRTAYALMGVGLHGRNGLDPAAALSLITTFVMPRMLYGLNATILQDSHIKQITMYHRTLLRQVQSLPPNVSSSAVYLLIGSLPAEALIDLAYLSLFGQIARAVSGNPLREIAIRQLAIKTQNSQSWFRKLSKIGDKYGLDINRAILHPWPKQAWKKHTRLLVNEHWLGKL